MKRRILYIVFLIGVLFPMAGKAQLLAVKTDGLKWALMSPNIGVEVVTGDKTSIDFSAYGNYKPWGKDMKMVVVQPEFRYWFNGRPMVREYIGFSLLAERSSCSLSFFSSFSDFSSRFLMLLIRK